VKIETLIGLVIILLMGTLTAYIGWKRGRNPTFWFIMGIFFGWLGFVVVYFLPKQEEVLKQREEELGKIQKKEEPLSLEKIEPVIEPVKDAPHSQETNWFYLNKEHQTQGPVLASTIEELWKKQEITRASFVWKEGMQDWKRVEELSDLYQLLQHLQKSPSSNEPL
jgi:hypothetical protein